MRDMFHASRLHRKRRQQARAVAVPPPLGGWNARDALANMEASDAVDLDNWMPQTSFVEIRGGAVEQATGMGDNGKTLMTYNKRNGTSELFCGTDAGLYDVTSAGAVDAAVLARTEGKHQWRTFGDGTNLWLIGCNGTDAPCYYDGTTWTAVTGATSPALTGVTTTSIVTVEVFKNRLLFGVNDELAFYYLPAGVAGGALTKFNLEGEAVRGGFLMAIGTWTRDAGDGLDDYAVFITSEGEAIVYQGVSPSSALTWQKVGTYFVGIPLGRRCLYQLGGDLILLTENGVFALSAALQSADVDSKLALSYKIERAFTDAARSYRAVFGWESINYPAQNALLVNIPQAEDGVHEQYVMNTITKAWCKFSGWNAETFGLLDEELYFTSGTSTFKAWSGQNDDGSAIVATARQAFNYFGDRHTLKQIKLFRPIFSINAALNVLVGLDVDFQTDPFTATLSSATPTIALWDTAIWDTDVWGSDFYSQKQWSSPAQWDGYAFAGKIYVVTNSVEVRWTSSDYVLVKGGVMS